MLLSANMLHADTASCPGSCISGAGRYTDELPRLGSKYLSSAGVEQLLDAADLHLLLGMKVLNRAPAV